LCFSHVTVPHIIISIVVSTVTVFFFWGGGGSLFSSLPPSPPPRPSLRHVTYLFSFYYFAYAEVASLHLVVAVCPHAFTYAHRTDGWQPLLWCCYTHTLYVYRFVCAPRSASPRPFSTPHSSSFFLLDRGLRCGRQSTYTHLHFFFLLFSTLGRNTTDARKRNCKAVAALFLVLLAFLLLPRVFLNGLSSFSFFFLFLHWFFQNANSVNYSTSFHQRLISSFSCVFFVLSDVSRRFLYHLRTIFFFSECGRVLRTVSTKLPQLKR
jgi:hypothetical protein